jgi:hypothetical protein
MRSREIRRSPRTPEQVGRSGCAYVFPAAGNRSPSKCAAVPAVALVWLGGTDASVCSAAGLGHCDSPLVQLTAVVALPVLTILRVRVALLRDNRRESRAAPEIAGVDYDSQRNIRICRGSAITAMLNLAPPRRSGEAFVTHLQVPGAPILYL